MLKNIRHEGRIDGETDLKNVLKRLIQILVFSDLDIKFLFKTSKYAAQNLFFWSLLFNRIEIAKIFWKMGDVTNKL